MSDKRFYYLGPWQTIAENGATVYVPPANTVGLVDLRPLSPVLDFGFFSTDQPINDSAYEPFGDVQGTRLDALTLSPAKRLRWRQMLGLPATPDAGTLLDVLWQTLTVYSDPDGETHAKPIMPTHLGLLELHLGGHSLIRSKTVRGRDTPHFAQMQRVLQNDYKEIRQQAIKDAKGKDEPVLHCKWLECMRRKLKLTEDEATGLLIPAGLPKEKPEKPTTTISDDFNRADGAIGANWADIEGVWAVASNAAKCGSATQDGRVRTAGDLSSSDMSVSSVSGADRGCIARWDASSSTSYYNSRTGWNGSIVAHRIFRSGVTQLLETAFGGATQILSASGSTLIISNGVSSDNVTDTVYSSGTRAGMYARYSTSSHDAFFAEDLVAAPTFLAAWANRRRRIIGGGII